MRRLADHGSMKSRYEAVKLHHYRIQSRVTIPGIFQLMLAWKSVPWGCLPIYISVVLRWEKYRTLGENKCGQANLPLLGSIGKERG